MAVHKRGSVSLRRFSSHSKKLIFRIYLDAVVLESGVILADLPGRSRG